MWMVKSIDSDEFIFFNNEPKIEWVGKGFNEYRKWIGEFDNPLDPWSDNPEVGRLTEDEVKMIFPNLYEEMENNQYDKGIEFKINIIKTYPLSYEVQDSKG